MKRRMGRRLLWRLAHEMIETLSVWGHALFRLFCTSSLCFLSRLLCFFCLASLLHILPIHANQYSSSSIYELRYHKEYQNVKIHNADVFGWLHIPGTGINLPLVQGKDNDYYLHHNPMQKKDSSGSIFLDYRNKIDLNNDNTILYGHNLASDASSMFSPLLAYEDQTFYENNPYLIVSLDHEIRYYKIFASYTTHTNFYYIQTDFDERQSLLELTSQIALRNRLESLVTYRMDARLLTLSTCSFRFADARFVVHAYLIDVREVTGT